MNTSSVEVFHASVFVLVFRALKADGGEGGR
jgi:hypothetical protein